MKIRSTLAMTGILLGLGLALSGCGRKGPLELPNGEQAQRPVDESGQVPTGDRALVSAASRYGSQAGIRQTLAAEDYEWRKDHDGRLLERLLSVSVYYKAYKPMELDQSAELERWRRLGIITPAAPPSGEAQQEVK